MSEDQIERHVERAFDRIDAQFMDNRISQAEYEKEVIEITKWASRQYHLNTSSLFFAD